MKASKFCLGEVAKFIRGITFKPTDLISPDGSMAVVCMRTKNVQKDIDERDLIAVPDNFVKREEQYLKEGDILVSTANSWELVGKCCWVPTLGYKATAGGFISILRGNEKKISPRYLYHWMASGKIQFMLRHCGRQTTNISNLSFERALNIEIPAPPLEEQKRIATILDKVDAIRRKRRQAIQLADTFLRSVFLDMFGDPVLNPKKWPEFRMDQISKIVSGVTKGRKFNNKQTVWVPYMRVANVQDGHINIADVQEIEVLESDVDKYRLEKGDLLLTEGGDPDKLGRGSVWKGEIDPCIHQNHIFRVRSDTRKAIPEYLSALIASPRGKRYFLRAAKQTTGVASINKTQLSNFPVLTPPLSLQQKYLSIVKKIEKIKDEITFPLESTERLFHSIAQRAFRGEL